MAALATGCSPGIAVTNVARVHPTIVTGSGHDTTIDLLGNNVVVAGAGNDFVLTGSGSDNLQGGAGNDILQAGSGIDQPRGDDGRDILIGGLGADRVFGNSGDDLLIAGYTSWDENQLALSKILDNGPASVALQHELRT